MANTPGLQPGANGSNPLSSTKISSVMDKKFNSILAFGDSLVAGFESKPEHEEYFSLYKQSKITLEDLEL